MRVKLKWPQQHAWCHCNQGNRTICTPNTHARTSANSCRESTPDTGYTPSSPASNNTRVHKTSSYAGMNYTSQSRIKTACFLKTTRALIEFRWKWLLKSALTRHTARNQPANKQQNKKKQQLRLWGDAVQRPQVRVMTDSPAGGWSPLCDSGLLTGWAISEQTHQQTLNYVLPKRSRDWSAAGNPNLTCCR